MFNRALMVFIALILALALVISPAVTVTASRQGPPFETDPPLMISITNTVPVAGSVNIALDTPVIITFDTPMEPSSVESAFSINPAVPGSFSWNNAGDTMTFTPANLLTANTTYMVSIGPMAQDTGGNTFGVAFAITFTTTSGGLLGLNVTSTGPANGDTDVPLGTTIAITFSAPMDKPSAESAFSINPAVPFASITWNSAGDTMTVNLATPLTLNTTYTVTIAATAKDTGGMTLAAPFNFSFTTTGQGGIGGLTVVGSKPVDGATNVALDTDIVITFNTPVDQGSVMQSFSISPSAGFGAVGWGISAEVTFSPSGSLKPNTTYKVTINTAAKDLAGNTLAAPFSFSFTTAGPGGPDTEAPTVKYTKPEDGDKKVSVDANIVVAFSEAMDTPSAEGAFSIPGVTGTFSWNAGKTVMTFNPDDDLKSAASYTATISALAKDLAGNTMTDDFTFSFTTASPPPAPPPPAPPTTEPSTTQPPTTPPPATTTEPAVIHDWYVSPDGDDTTGDGTEDSPLRTIRKAIGKADSGDTIHILPGTYTENLNISKDLTIIGESENASDVVIDGNKSGVVISAANADGNWKHFTVQNGKPGGMKIRQGQFILLDLIVKGNSGDGIAISGGSGVIRDCTISENTGNGIYGADCHYELDGNLIEKCTRDGINIQGYDLSIKNNIVRENKKNGMSLSGKLEIENNVVAENGDTGIFIGYPALQFNNNTVSGNDNGVSFDDQYKNYELFNNIIWGNSQTDYSSPEEATYSDIGSGDSAGTGNISEDPLFVNPDDSDYQLQEGSPAIDSGTGDGAPNYDLTGADRPVDGNGDDQDDIDMGAYEYAP